MREARLILSLLLPSRNQNTQEWQHPLIARLAGNFEEGGSSFLVLPFYEHGSLRLWVELLRPQSLSALSTGHATDVRSVFRQLLQALSFLHAHRIVHRDVKPENVMLQVGPSRERRGLGQHLCLDLLSPGRHSRQRDCCGHRGRRSHHALRWRPPLPPPRPSAFCTAGARPRPHRARGLWNQPRCGAPHPHCDDDPAGGPDADGHRALRLARGLGRTAPRGGCGPGGHVCSRGAGTGGTCCPAPVVSAPLLPPLGTRCGHESCGKATHRRTVLTRFRGMGAGGSGRALELEQGAESPRAGERRPRGWWDG